jgi:superfamily I DNA/RNA helicase
MQFRIADTFTASLIRLPTQDQKGVKMTVFDLQVDPAAPGLQLHRVDRSLDKNFWTARVSDDIRIVLHRTSASLLLCYAGRHDDAYRWAEKRRIETHPSTGAAQLVEVVQRQEQLALPLAARAAKPPSLKPPLFAATPAEQLLSYGVPPDWIASVQAVDEDSLFALAGHLPAEAMDALLELAVGGKPALPVKAPPTADPFAHPDAQRRFRVVANQEELRLALEFPWEKWTVFLHPAQRDVVERRYGGPARVSGSAGTGKTVVALHRAAHLTRDDAAARVLLATFSKPLAQALKVNLDRLVAPTEPAASRITVGYVDGIAHRLHTEALGSIPNIAAGSQIEAALKAAAKELKETRFTERFLLTEWRQVVDAWQLRSWEAYRDVSRLGRKTRIGGSQREALWALFQRAQEKLRERNVMTWAEVVARVTAHYAARSDKPFSAAVIDEAQDVSIPQLRLLAAIVPPGSDNLFFAGDLGQRIFQPPFSWLSQGVDVRGRSITLKVNYRTSHQIRRRADLLLPAHVRDVDGIEEGRKGTISVFEGPEPDVRLCADEPAEIAFVGAWIAERIAGGVAPGEVLVLVRSAGQLDRAKAAVKAAGQKWMTLTDRAPETGDRIGVGEMHFAKGLEARAVAVMACDNEVIPLQSRIESASEDSELDEIFDSERHLLYVACTRARDHVSISGVAPGSEFLGDLIDGD